VGKRADREEYEMALRGYFPAYTVWHLADGSIELTRDAGTPAPPLAPTDTYSSHVLPPDVGRDRFHRLVRDCPGAFKTGRLWQVPARSWRDWRAGKAQEQAPIVDDARALAYAERLSGCA
jgi:hypothetical protein